MSDSNKDIELNSDQQRDLLKELLKKALEDKKNIQENAPKNIEKLNQLKEIYLTENQFEVGQIIKWKNHMKNRSLPEYNEPAIILEILEDPFIDQSESISSTYFNEKYDIKIGVLKDNTFLTFYFDSKRFETF